MLQQRGEQNILMWIVAPQIPNSVREFLDRLGIIADFVIAAVHQTDPWYEEFKRNAAQQEH
jgi:hypothetical protein